MIKFFRKIRKQLISENKFSKYLIYAIGEILLVVIGILIAIQLNESRNNSFKHKQKENILKTLQLEFQSNLSQLDTVLYYNQKIINAYPKVIEQIKSQHIVTDEKKVREMITDLAYTWSFNSSNGSLRSGISSGEIHLINSNRLIELLFSWEDVVKDSYEEANQLRTHQYGAMHIYQDYFRIGDLWAGIFSGLDSRNYTPDFQGLFKDISFADYASIRFIYSTDYVTELNVLKSQNLEIMELIDQELSK